MIQPAENVTIDNECVILTLDNIVVLMGSAVVSGELVNNVFAVMPERIRPTHEIFLPICVNSDNMNSIRIMKIDADGNMSVDGESLASGSIYLNGLTFNVNDTWYNAEIGNNWPQGTSPLRWNEEQDAVRFLLDNA